MTVPHSIKSVLAVSMVALVAGAGFGHVPEALAQSVPMPQTAAPIAAPTPADQLEKLATALLATEQQVEKSRLQIQEMQAEIDKLRIQLAASGGTGRPVVANAPPAAAAAVELAKPTAEDLDMLQSAVVQQQQTKVESASRLPVHVVGLVLFNGFLNRGNVDRIDLPSAALRPSTTNSNNSAGASLRQSILGLEGTGPILGGAKTTARVSMDFFGGVTETATGGPAGIVRLRTAAIAASWAHDVLEASYDSPLISPLSPDSFATVAQPSLAWSGNLWVWAPQIAWKHSFPLAQPGRAFNLQAGLLDTQSWNAASGYLAQPSTGAGEASGLPSFETRLSFNTGGEAHRLELGIGAIYGRQTYSGKQQVDTWASTADWIVPLSRRAHLSGEWYRGRGLGSLGGGAYRDVVATTSPNGLATYLRALDSTGGWLQGSYRLFPALNGNVAIGQDSASGKELRNAIPFPSTNPIFYYARNRSVVVNLIYRPWSSIILSPEYRLLESWPVSGSSSMAHVFTMTFGYQF